jgi:hypothetical protein
MAARARTLRALPLALGAVGAGVSISLYAKSHSAKLDDTPYDLATDHNAKAKDLRPIGTAAPFTPLAWGSNAHLTLVNDTDVKGLRRPTPMAQLGGTPLRDLIVHEKYGAAVDARGDLWMWGTGYDASGDIGRSLRGKVSSAG